MEMQEIISLLTNGVFSIVMCGALFWYVVKQGEMHKQEMDALKDTLANNTLALQHLSDLIAAQSKEK